MNGRLKKLIKTTIPKVKDALPQEDLHLAEELDRGFGEARREFATLKLTAERNASARDSLRQANLESERGLGTAKEKARKLEVQLRAATAKYTRLSRRICDIAAYGEQTILCSYSEGLHALRESGVVDEPTLGLHYLAAAISFLGRPGSFTAHFDLDPPISAAVTKDNEGLPVAILMKTAEFEKGTLEARPTEVSEERLALI